MTPILNGNLPSAAPDLSRFAQSVALFFDRGRASAQILVGAEGAVGANKRRFTVKVVDRLKRDALGRWLLDVWIATADFGTPGGAQTVTFNKGAAKDTLAANTNYRAITDANGVAELDIDAGAGAQTRYLMVSIDGEVFSSGAQQWT